MRSDKNVTATNVNNSNSIIGSEQGITNFNMKKGKQSIQKS